MRIIKIIIIIIIIIITTVLIFCMTINRDGIPLHIRIGRTRLLEDHMSTMLAQE